MHFISGRQDQFLARKSSFFHATPISSRFFGVRKIRLNGIISPPYPEVTLDNFGFPVGGRLAARRAFFWPPGRNFAILSNWGQKTAFLDPKRATLGNRGHETARQAAKRPPTGKLKVSRVTSGYGGLMIPLSRDMIDALHNER